MPDTETLAARVRALERHLTEADTDALPPAPDRGAIDDLGARLDGIEARVDELDADLQAVRGFAGELDAVNDAVERRADAALAAADRLETRRSSTHGPTAGVDTRPGDRPLGRDRAVTEGRSDDLPRTPKDLDDASTATGAPPASESPGLLDRLRGLL